jgi:hypothetical protein
MLKKIGIWPKTSSILNNEEGVVIIAALMVLVLLTIIGVASTNVSNTEVKIATHELIYQTNFYRAEGATLEALAAMDSIENPETDPPSYLWRDKDTFDEQTTPYDSTFWDGSMTGAEVDPVPSSFSDLPYTHYVVVNKGLKWSMNNTDAETDGGIYEYVIYGHCAPPDRGATTVEIGYLKAF